jgi:hypothetical protein
VPNEKFGSSYADTFIACFNWAVEADKSKLVCANGLEWLVRDGSHTSWPTADCSTFLDATRRQWNEW